MQTNELNKSEPLSEDNVERLIEHIAYLERLVSLEREKRRAMVEIIQSLREVITETRSLVGEK